MVLAGHHEASVRAVAEELVAAGHKALAIRCDVADEAQVAAMVEQTVSTFGRLDAAFNNAGVQSPIAETADASGEEFDRVHAINLRGVWSCMKYELLQMPKQGSGVIVTPRRSVDSWASPGGERITPPSTGARADEERCAQICLQGHPHQRGLPGDHRDADGRRHAGQ